MDGRQELRRHRRLGPYVVTADELPPGGRGLRLETRLNGVTVQSASTTDMLFDGHGDLHRQPGHHAAGRRHHLLRHAGRRGFGRTPKLYMKAGDTVEVEIERIGLLRNRIQDQPKAG